MRKNAIRPFLNRLFWPDFWQYILVRTKIVSRISDDWGFRSSFTSDAIGFGVLAVGVYGGGERRPWHAKIPRDQGLWIGWREILPGKARQHRLSRLNVNRIYPTPNQRHGQQNNSAIWNSYSTDNRQIKKSTSVKTNLRFLKFLKSDFIFSVVGSAPSSSDVIKIF